MQNLTYNLKRTVGYIVGFILFYEPFMFFNQIASTFITDTSFSSIHVPCARIPLANIVTGEWLATSTNFLPATRRNLAVVRSALLRQALLYRCLQ